MSKGLKNLIEKMSGMVQFRTELLNAGDAEERIKIAHGAGFDCTSEEIEQALSELNDEELDFVAGGSGLGDFVGHVTEMGIDKGDIANREGKNINDFIEEMRKK